LSGRGLCDELITCPEESYRLCCVVVCDLETSRIGAPYIYDISRLRVKGIFGVRNLQEQYRQCTYNGKLRSVSAAIVAEEKQWILHILSVCICSLRYPTCNAPYCYLWSVPLYNIFSHLINDTI